MNTTLALLILAVVGLLVYVLATNDKAQTVGKIVLFCACLALCLSMGRVLAGLR